MRIEPRFIAREYYEDVKHLYPELTFEEFMEICYVPWKYTRKHINSGELCSIRLKYFGLFNVQPREARAELKHMEMKLARGTLSEKNYNRVKEVINIFLKNEDNKNKN